MYSVYHIAEGLARSVTLNNDGQKQARLAVLVLGSPSGTSPFEGNNRLITALQSIRVDPKRQQAEGSGHTPALIFPTVTSPLGLSELV